MRENLADTARERGEAVRDVRGYEYAVINDHELFPFKCADCPKPLERARLAANASPTRRRMLLSHGPEPQVGLFPLDDELTAEKYEELHETFEALGASTKLVCLFFTADPENGIHVIHWGRRPPRTRPHLHLAPQ
ncbi:hypothetical protein AB0C70_31440 [Streptomyces sp. NPDC048564]|uniref:hypothetical protein n=1 Tax=Streptomyces sp. NPDC048564 TaxID=3155760 RepID=UPI0034483502